MKNDLLCRFGVRTELNNQGRPIHPESAGITAFWSWFEDSFVVDQAQAPVVAFHGASFPHAEFRTGGGKGKTFGTGTFFSSNPAVANTYTGSDANGVLVPAYLKITMPVIVHAEGANWNGLNRRTKIELPSAIVSDAKEKQFVPDLFGRLTVQGPTRRVKARNTTLGRLFAGEMEYADDYASTDDLARWARDNGYDGLILRNVIDTGPSGKMKTSEARIPSDLYVVFDPRQIKSAIGNPGSFDPMSAHIADGHEIDIGTRPILRNSTHTKKDDAEEDRPRRGMRP